MGRFNELGLNPGDSWRVAEEKPKDGKTGKKEKHENPEKGESPEKGREIMEKAAGEREKLLGSFSERMKERVMENLLPAAKSTLAAALKHSWGVGSVVEGYELIRNKNYITGKELSGKEKFLRYAAISFEVLAMALVVYSLQQGEGQKILADLKVDFHDAATQMHFQRLYHAIKEITSSPHAFGITSSEMISSSTGYLQDAMSLGSTLKKWGDRINQSQAGEFLLKAYNTIAPKFSYGK
jgi:hypothetical protein